MIVYILATLLACFFAYVYQRLKSSQSESDSIVSKLKIEIFLISAVTPLFLLSALRVGVGKDYWSYVRAFNLQLNGGFSNLEPGFRLINSVVIYFAGAYQWVFVASALIMFTFLAISISRSAYAALSTYLFCNLSFLYFSLNTTRQFIAIAIVLFSIQYIVDRKFTRYVFSVIFASLFHMSALFMIPMYYVLNIRFKPYHYAVIFGLAAMIYRFKERVVDLILYLYPQYGIKAILLYTAKPSEIFILTDVLLLILILYLLKKKSISRGDALTRVGINITYFSLLMHTVLYWIPLVDRASLYIDISLIILIPYFISKVKDRNLRFRLVLFLLIYTSVYTFISIAVRDSHSVIPYNSILTWRPL